MIEDRDDEHIGPYNGHNKSEAAPHGCAIIFISMVAFVAVMGLYGFYADWRKSTWPPAEVECPPYWKCTPKAEWNDPNCGCWDKR